MWLRIFVLALLIFVAAFGAHEVMHLVVIYAVGGQGSIIVRPWRLGLVDFQIPSLHAQPVEPLGLVQQALVNFLGPPHAHARPAKMASSKPCRGKSILSAELHAPLGEWRVSWSTILVSLASWPPMTTTSPPGKVTPPPPLDGWGRSGRRTHAPLTMSKQSTRAVVGERPPATHASPPATKPMTWLRGSGSEGSTVHPLVAGS